MNHLDFPMDVSCGGTGVARGDRAKLARAKKAFGRLAMWRWFFILTIAFSTTALAGDEGDRWEVFSGLETSNNATSTYLGGGYAFGDGLDAPGFRVRAVGALGHYDYDGTLFNGSRDVSTNFDGDVSFLAALAGYQFHPGKTILKAFAGVEVIDNDIDPFDPNNSVQGTEIGVRVALELWRDISDRWFVSADGVYGSAFQDYFQLTRLGFRLNSWLSLGLEGGVLGNQEYDAGRGGGFARVKFREIEATLSGGFTGDYLLSDPSGYAALSAYRRF